MLVRDGLNYSFTHRSFQEYFAALYTVRLTDAEMYTVMTYLMSNPFFAPGSFFPMLYNMQNSRLNKVVLLPLIERIKQSYDRHGFSVEFLAEHISHLHIMDCGEDEGFSLLYSEKDEVLSNARFLVCWLNDFARPYMNNAPQDTLEKLYDPAELREADDFFSKDYTIQDAVAILGDEELLKCMHTLHEQLLFCFTILDRYAISKDVDESNIADLLDSL